MIAICLSTYNGEKFLAQQLKSIETQSYKLSEVLLIIRDDGSIDESYKIIQEFVQNTTIYVKLLDDRTNYGVKKSFEILMNTALEINAQYIMFCDQDDIWKQNKIEKTYLLMKVLEETYSKDIPLLVHSDLMVVDENLEVIASSFWQYQHIDPSKDSLNRLLLHNVVTGCTIMSNRSLAEKVKNIPPEVIMHDWWIAMVASAFGKIAYINEPLMLYRQHGKNDTGAKKYNFHYIWKTFSTKLLSGQYQSKLDKYILQSCALLTLYGDELNIYKKTMLGEFSAFDKLSKFQKLRVLFKYKIWKNGFIRNLGLVFFA